VGYVSNVVLDITLILIDVLQVREIVKLSTPIKTFVRVVIWAPN
jgi:hypothetical protein